MGSSGEFEAPDRVDCAITASAGGMTAPMDKLVVIPPDAWIDMGGGWTAATATDPNVVGDLELCPGSSLFWGDLLPSPLNLGGITGQPAFINGVLATRLSLVGVVQSLPVLGTIPEGSTVDIWVAQDGGWLVALQFATTVGGEPTQIRVDVTNHNDPTISINPP